MPSALREVPTGLHASSRRAFVVVGMHRSGTSAMTRTLSLLGATLPARLMPAREANNATGFWEPMSVAELNDEILEALDSEWDDVFAFRPRPYLSNFDHFYRSRAVEILEQEFHGSELIVLKDPRVSILTTFWERALQDAGYTTNYVIMVRNPIEVAESLGSRDGFPREKSLLLWSSYMLAAERDTRGRARTFVTFDELIRDWRAVCRRIAGDSGLPFPRETIASAIEIDRFLDGRLRHHRVGAEDIFSRPDIPAHVKSLYRIFLEASEGRELDRSELRRIEAELSQVEELVGPLVADLRSRGRQLVGEVGQLKQANDEAKARADSLAEELAAERRLREEQSESAARVLERLAAAEEEAKRLALKLTWVETERTSLTEEVESQRASATMAQAELERLQLEYGAELRRAEAAWSSAEAAVRTTEEILSEREQVLAATENLLREQQRRNDEMAADIAWLGVVSERLARPQRWWGLLPWSWRLAHEKRRLRRLGLFDADAYRAQHPDVREEGLDPLQHYLRHGIREGRARSF